VDERYEPLLVDSTQFVHHYQNKGLVEIIHGLSWVTECFGILDQIKRDPFNTKFKERLLNVIIPELKKEPVGEKGLICLNNIILYLENHKSLDQLEEKIEILLKDLSIGYRFLLKRYVTSYSNLNML
jgi:hypothetical protein